MTTLPAAAFTCTLLAPSCRSRVPSTAAPLTVTAHRTPLLNVTETFIGLADANGHQSHRSVLMVTFPALRSKLMLGCVPDPPVTCASYRLPPVSPTLTSSVTEEALTSSDAALMPPPGADPLTVVPVPRSGPATA